MKSNNAASIKTSLKKMTLLKFNSYSKKSSNEILLSY